MVMQTVKSSIVNTLDRDNIKMTYKGMRFSSCTRSHKFKLFGFFKRNAVTVFQFKIFEHTKNNDFMSIIQVLLISVCYDGWTLIAKISLQ